MSLPPSNPNSKMPRSQWIAKPFHGPASAPTRPRHEAKTPKSNMPAKAFSGDPATTPKQTRRRRVGEPNAGLA